MKKTYKEKIYDLLWVFLISGILGFILESIFCIIMTGRLENRSTVIYGPFNLIYACAGVTLVLVSYIYNPKREIHLLLAFIFVAGALEYFSSYLQEIFFGTSSWDYSKFSFNINGRTNLFYDLVWAVIGVFYVKDAYPIIKRISLFFSDKRGLIITWILIILVVSDNLLTFSANYRARERHKDVPAQNDIQRLLDTHYSDDYLNKKFPNMTHTE